ncbi:hypothetical protein NOR53_1654 [gamma proteobacterium NOR5-3]|nr:hypothetical protein NOR53_1654 [gamma proteobacterium NOR5-3]
MITDVLANLQSHLECSEAHIKDIRFDKRHADSLYGVALYLSILELSTSAHVLCAADRISGIEILLRTLLEAFVDLTNLRNDPRYSWNIEAADIEQWLIVMRKARAGGNPHLAGLASQPGFDANLKAKSERLAELKRNGYPPLKVNKRFATAGLKDQYDSLYNQLCTEGHNNIRAMTSRHFQVDKEGGEVRVVYNKNAHDGSHDHLITTVSGVVLRAGVLVHSPPTKNVFVDRLERFDREEREYFGLS